MNVQVCPSLEAFFAYFTLIFSLLFTLVVYIVHVVVQFDTADNTIARIQNRINCINWSVAAGRENSRQFSWPNFSL